MEVLPHLPIFTLIILPPKKTPHPLAVFPDLIGDPTVEYQNMAIGLLWGHGKNSRFHILAPFL
jgi:hypothetical protein